MTTTTTTKIASRRTGRTGTEAIAKKVASLLEGLDSYGTASIDVSLTAQWRRYGPGKADRADAVVRIVTD